MQQNIDLLVQELFADDRDRRKSASSRLAALGADAVEHLLPYYGEHALRIGLVFEEMADAADALRAIRRAGPGRLRRPALRALADLGGGDALDAKDRAAVERLVRTKLRDPRLPDLPADRWLAVPAASGVDAVAEALGLHDPRPVTVALGLSAVFDSEDAIEHTTADGGAIEVHRVFVTPEFQDWRFVYGPAFLAAGWHQALLRLSARCGQAQMYFDDDHNRGKIWWVAHNGEDRRSFHTYREPRWAGDPLPEEYEFAADPEYLENGPDLEEIAWATAAHPRWVLEEDMVGHGLLGVTHAGVGHGRFRGALTV